MLNFSQYSHQKLLVILLFVSASVTKTHLKGTEFCKIFKLHYNFQKIFSFSKFSTFKKNDYGKALIFLHVSEHTTFQMVSEFFRSVDFSGLGMFFENCNYLNYSLCDIKII